MSSDELYKTLLRYEAHAVDPVTGQLSIRGVFIGNNAYDGFLHLQRFQHR